MSLMNSASSPLPGMRTDVLARLEPSKPVRSNVTVAGDEDGFVTATPVFVAWVSSTYIRRAGAETPSAEAAVTVVSEGLLEKIATALGAALPSLGTICIEPVTREGGEPAPNM